MAPGSYFVVSHGTSHGYDDMPPDADKQYDRTTTPFVSRTRNDVMGLMAGTELVEPGLVWTPQWRPDSPDDVGDHPELMAIFAGVGRKP
jgi:hypothetical protein